MWYQIDPASGAPIYRQLVDQVQQAVASGVLKPGDRLPSVRDLAVELTVNPNTIAKAYRELELTGIIETSRGRGSFIADRDLTVSKAERLQQFALAAERLVAEAYRLGIKSDQAVEVFRDRILNAERRRSHG